jgi:hypothetical protein
MSYADAPDPRSFCQRCQDVLATVDQLQCHSPEPHLTDRVIDIHLLVYQNDTVVMDSIQLREGRPSLSQPQDGNYQLTVSDATGEILDRIRFPLYYDYTGPVLKGVDYSGIRFDPVTFDYKVPFTEAMKRLDLSHDGRVIFSTELDFCNANQVCDPMETFETCPADCPLNRSDSFCTPANDDVCDPDCWEGVDPDCSVRYSGEAPAPTQTPLPIGSLVVAFIVVILANACRRK